MIGKVCSIVGNTEEDYNTKVLINELALVTGLFSQRTNGSAFMASGVFVEQKLPDGQTHARFLLPLVAKRNTKDI